MNYFNNNKNNFYYDEILKKKNEKDLKINANNLKRINKKNYVDWEKSDDNDSDDIENQKRNQVLKIKGQGRKAIDEDSDRTVTENSDYVSEGEIKKSKIGSKVIYSTKQDQEDGYNYNSNYEQDEFEDEEDPEDDFNLPWDH